MNKIDTILHFLKDSNTTLAKLYTSEMECQVNVTSGGGKPISNIYKGKTWRGYTDGIETWKAFRIPWNAYGDTQFTDKEINWNFEKHVQAIGLTGWNWVTSESVYVGFDIDSIINHKEGLTEKELIQIETKCSSVPWLNLYRSTGGKGIHLYIFFEKPIKTNNHTEHAALARSLLSVLTIKLGINFIDKTDTSGSILWIWHEKIEGTGGLQPLYTGEEKFPNSFVPKDWRKHIVVTSKKSNRIKLTDSAIQPLYAGTKNTDLTKEHKKILTWLDKNAEKNFWWDFDWNMLICHTLDLKILHKQLKLKGLFDTISSGSSEHNCFMFPINNGGWVIRRYGSKITEHSSWLVDEKGWTKCHFNMIPSFYQAVNFFGGKESIGNEFVFSSPSLIQLIFDNLNINFSVINLPKQEISIRKTNNKIYLKLPKIKGVDYEKYKDLNFYVEKTNYYLKVIYDSVEQDLNETILPDSFIRSVIAEKTAAGWYINVNNYWILHPENNVKAVLQTIYKHLKAKDITIQIGESILNPWKLVNKPFRPEYTGNREWNKDAAMFSTAPLSGSYPHWQLILDHIGTNLNETIQNEAWFSSNCIYNGADYLFYWISSMFQKPYMPLPYLFLTGVQNTGKSILHEALYLCFKGGKGYIRANSALQNNQGFNGELHGAILAICEEIDLRKTNAYNRIKDWVTGETILIRDLYKTSFEAKNTLHFIQCSNDSKYCPIFPGDTRIVVILVNQLTHEIPKDLLIQELKKELPYFLYDILNTELPKLKGRLGLPIVTTYYKEEIEASNLTLLEEFLSYKCFYREGHKILWKHFYQSFKMFLNEKRCSPSEVNSWSERQTSLKFPMTNKNPKGKFGAGHKVYIGNMAFIETEKDLQTKFVKETNNRIKEV